jgi:prolyl-tRNA synthetase
MQAALKVKAKCYKSSVHLDDREELTPGFKFNDWEMRGVPLRIEIGPKDIENNSVAISRRDIPGRDGKSFIPQSGLENVIESTLEAIQNNLLHKAEIFRDEHIFEATSYEQFKEVIANKGWASVWWSESNENEARIKEETKATIRCLPVSKSDDEGNCFYSGKKTKQRAYFAKAY